MYNIEMPYKELIRNQWEIIARYRIIKASIVWKCGNIQIARNFSLHRNSVANILKLYKKHKTAESENILKSYSKITQEDIITHFSFLKSKSRKPHKLRWTANIDIETIVCKEFSILWYGYRRMLKHLKRKGDIPDSTKEWLIKWIYKRRGFKVKRVRTKNKQRRALYNYRTISPFEYLHYDVKHILDQKALPEEIYQKFEINSELPIYQRTIIEVKTRWRFLAYSNTLNSTFGIEFLKFTLMFIRNQWIDWKIKIWVDGGTEFCGGWEKKLAEWNNILQTINCEVYQYDGARDIRKNLIERSHRSDDEEFYVPRWYFINKRKQFIKEAKSRYMHWNYTRIHIGIEMWVTPYEKLKGTWVWKLKWREKFPVLILDECIWDLMYHTKTLHLKRALDDTPERKTQKDLVDFQVNFNILNNVYAQNVLTHYQKRSSKICKIFFLE